VAEVPAKTPVVLLHGFTQTGRSWLPVVDATQHLAPGLRFVLPDAPGHGLSAPIVAGLWESADLLAAVVPETADWGGYSMGGRMALHVALAHPSKVRRLVLISTTAGIEGPLERLARQRADEALADRAEAEGTERFLEQWLSQPLFSTLAPEQAGLGARRENAAAGLASSLRYAGTGAQEPLWDRLAELRQREVPVLVMAGALDSKYSRLAHRLARAIGPTASLEIVAGAGHACHLERPAEVGAALAAFCTEA